MKPTKAGKKTKRKRSEVKDLEAARASGVKGGLPAVQITAETSQSGPSSQIDAKSFSWGGTR